MKRIRSKLLDNPPEYGGPLWGAYQYEKAKEANRGHNYRYWNDKWWEEMEKKGWKMWAMKDSWGDMVDYTGSEIHAQEQVQILRQLNNSARIICGYHQTVQRHKFFTVIYKKK